MRNVMVWVVESSKDIEVTMITKSCAETLSSCIVRDLHKRAGVDNLPFRCKQRIIQELQLQDATWEIQCAHLNFHLPKPYLKCARVSSLACHILMRDASHIVIGSSITMSLNLRDSALTMYLRRV
jgi:hypothetical protein